MAPGGLQSTKSSGRSNGQPGSEPRHDLVIQSNGISRPNATDQIGITDDFTHFGLGTTAAGMIYGQGEGEGVLLCSDSKVMNPDTKTPHIDDYAEKIVKVEENIYIARDGNYLSAKCIAVACKLKAERYRLKRAGQCITTMKIAKYAAKTGKRLCIHESEPCQLLVAGFTSTDQTPQLFKVEYGMDHEPVKHGGIGTGIRRNVDLLLYREEDDLQTCELNCLTLLDYACIHDEATGGSLRFVQIYREGALRQYTREQAPENRGQLYADRDFIRQHDGYDWCHENLFGNEAGMDEEDGAFHDA